MEIYHFEKLLLNFKLLKKSNEYEPTFLEISGYPHYENVCSNILAFYFDTNNTHQFKDLFLKSLIQTIDGTIYNNEAIETISIRREFIVDENKRIDLIIETSDVVYVIENKIYHHLNNKLEIYRKTIERVFPNKQKKYIVLSLRNENVYANFSSITYNDFFIVLKQNIGQYALSANNKYLTFVLEFIKSIENLTEMTVNKEMFDFILINKDEIEKLAEEKRIIDQQLNNECNLILSIFSDDYISLQKKWIWNKNTLVFDFAIENKIIAVDLTINLTEISCEIFDRNSSNLYETLDKLKLIQENNYTKTHRGYLLLNEPVRFYNINKEELLNKVHQILTQIVIK